MKPMDRESVKSDEEWAMVRWLQECVRHNLISDWEYEPRSFELFPSKTFTEVVQMKTKEKAVEKFLHRSESYTPDFYFEMTKEGKKLLFNAFKAGILATHEFSGYMIYVDVKGAFNPYQGDERYFSIVRKAMYAIHGIWIEKVIPFSSSKKSSLFMTTFAPDEFRWMKKRTQPTLTVCGMKCDTVQQFTRGV